MPICCPSLSDAPPTLVTAHPCLACRRQRPGPLTSKTSNAASKMARILVVDDARGGERGWGKQGPRLLLSLL